MASASQNKKPRRPPATTVEGRENQLIADTYDLAERLIREGTASSQIITHFLKMGTERERLEREKLRRESIVLERRVVEMDAGARGEERMEKALEAFRRYSGNHHDDESDEYYRD